MKAFSRLVMLLALVASNIPAAYAAATPATPPTCRLTASAKSVNYNTSVRLDWQSTNSTGAYLQPIGGIPVNGFTYVVPGKNTTYTASFTGPGGTAVCAVGIAVSSGTPVNGGGTVNGGGSVDTNGSSINTNNPVNTSGSSINTNGSINTNNPINTNGSINTSGSINTNNPIDTNHPIDTNAPVNLNGPNPTLPNIAIAPSAPASGSSGGLLSGIVPAECRGSSTVANCDLCSLGQLMQNVANFLLGLTVPAAALLFAWAGILFFSARGVPDQINRAKKIFMSVVIGFVIAVSAWILVITVMQTLVHGSDFAGWDWRSLKCADTRKARLYDMRLTDYLKSSLPGLSSTPTGTTGGSAYGCTTGTLVGNTCRDTSGAVIGTPTTIITSDGAMTCDQYGSGYAVAGGQCYSADSTVSAGPARSSIDAEQDALADACDSGNNVSCSKLNTLLAASDTFTADASRNYTSEQKVLLSSCRGGDFSSCDAFSKSSGSGPLGDRISDATANYMGTKTSTGPGNGRVACAWAVNNVLSDAGIAPIDGDSVYLMQQQLEQGRGVQVGTDSNLANTKAGDIVVWKTDTMSHVGICVTDRCTEVSSNSSGDKKFGQITDASFNGKSTSQIYHVIK